MFAIVAKFIKEVGKWMGLQIRDSIKPMFIISKAMIKEGQIPVRVTSPDNMWRLSHSESVYECMFT
jgi:antitoxin component of RelBE/YafQ-DinJ toxin-antitoxin module